MRSLKETVCSLGVVVAFAWAVAMPSAPLWGQTVQGVITGTVFDAAGAVVPNATVTLTNEGTNIAQTKTTGSDGGYRFDLVPPGSYTVSGKATHFAEKITKNVIVDPSQTVSLNITLAVAAATTAVEVTSQAALVQTSTSDLAHTISNTTIMNIPLLSRNVYDLAFAAPQVTPGLDLNATSAGARESGTGYLLNGSDNNNNFSEGSVNVTPPLESVAEFTLLTNSMSAQYGRAAGAVVSAAQKTGTNQLHGALYEFNRNRSLNASDFFQNRQGSPKPKYIRNQFGGEVDGPIIKNKTFFALGYDKVALHTGSETDTTVPTASELQAISAGAGPLAQSYLQKYPPITSGVVCPNEPAAAIGHIGCDHFFDPIEDPQTQYYGRVDHNFSETDRVSFTANIYRETYNDNYGGGYPGSRPINYIDKEHYHNFTLVETHTLGPNVFNEVTVAHNRHYSTSLEGGGKFADPYIAIDGDSYGGFGFGFGPYEGGLVVGFVQDRWQLQDNVGWTHGRHSVKFGGSWQHGILYRNWDLGLPGEFEFGNTMGPMIASAVSTGDVTLNADGSMTSLSDQTISNFQHDFPYFQELSIDPHTGQRANAYRHYIMNDNNLFVQDDFKFSPRLTLNLGLRWERYGAPYEQHNALAQLLNFNCLSSTSVSFVDCVGNARVGPAKRMWNTRNHDFAPRVGFAYDLSGNGRTSLRAGFGISYDRIFDNVWSNGAWNPPFYALGDWQSDFGDSIFYRDPPKPSPSYVPDSLPGPAGRVSIRTMENNLKDSSVQNYYFGLEHQIASNMLLRVNYQGSMGRHLPVLMNWNRYDGDRYNKNLTLLRPNTLYTGFNYRSNNVTSNYNAFVLELQRRFSNGLQFQGGYTWSHLLDFGSDLFTGETTLGKYSQPYYFVSNAHKGLEYASGGFDHRHALKFLFSYELPVMREQRGVLGKIAGGWQITGFYQGYSGHPIEIFSSRARFKGNARDANGFLENVGGDYNLDGLANDHPDFMGVNTTGYYSNQSPADGIFADNNPIGCGSPGAQSTNTADCNAAFGVTTPNLFFVNPPGTGVRFGRLGRNVFHGPWFNGFDAGLFKNFQVSERWKLQFRAEALNLPNHPSFDGISGDLNSASNFGKAQCTVGDANCPAATAPARRFQLGMRLLF